MHLKEITQRACDVKTAIFDGDGVLFTGRVFIDERGERLKERSLVDGQGLLLLLASGVRIAFVSGESTGFIQVIADKINSLPLVKNGTWTPVGVFTGRTRQGKVEAIDAWLVEAGLTWLECAYMGDDLPDYKILQKVGFPAAPAQAEKAIKDLCVYTAERCGGDGAIRDLTNFILEAKGINPTMLALC